MMQACVLSCPVLSPSLLPHALQPARLLRSWDFPGKNTGVGCQFLLQRIFPTQGSNSHLPRWQVPPGKPLLSLSLSLSLSAAAAAAKSFQLCPTLCNPIDGSPPGSPVPWDSPGQNTGVGCHFLLQCRKVKSESEVAESCLTLSNPMDCSLPGSSVHAFLQARILEWVAISFSRGSSRPRRPRD